MAVKLRQSKQRLLHVEAVTGLLLFTHHKQTSTRTDGDIYQQARTYVDNRKEKQIIFLFSLAFYIII